MNDGDLAAAVVSVARIFGKDKYKVSMNDGDLDAPVESVVRILTKLVVSKT